jgi:hypothetical protein
VAISTSNSYCLGLHDDGGLAVGGVGVYYKDIKVSMDLYLCRTRRKFSTASWWGWSLFQKIHNVRMELHLCKTSEFLTGRLTGGVGVGAVGATPQKFGKGVECAPQIVG